jgi:lipopolysaccharide transport system ATP-binding protein
MSATVISVNDISKVYRLGAINRRTLADEIAYGWLKLRGKDPVAHMGKLGMRRAARNPEFWALRGVSFTVQQGDVLGIVGHNGAGKSTLLKILTRITEPTAGTAALCGRVGSLLEIGTGFHPELTGRENVFMNGTILGMKRREIAAKFDEIVAFSEIEQFIDTPVKRYSSGMYVRLAFAVAAHLEPEILLVDEVLAVGDAAFQKKCLGKMGDVARKGRTVLFVSHNIGAVESLCPEVLWLEGGRVRRKGAADEICTAYLREVSQPENNVIPEEQRRGSGLIKTLRFWWEDADGNSIPVVREGERVRVVLECEATRDLEGVDVSISLLTFDNQTFFSNYSSYQRPGQLFAVKAGRSFFAFEFPYFPFKAGRYRVGAGLVARDQEADWPMQGIGVVDVAPGTYYPHDRTAKHGYGLVMLHGAWTRREA